MKKENYLYNAVCTKVVDGDTIDVNVDLGFTVWVKIRLRLQTSTQGIDTPELNDANPENRAKANIAKQFLVDTILNKQVVIHSFKTDKYGRWLADVYLDGVSMPQRLLDEGYAVPYK